MTNQHIPLPDWRDNLNGIPKATLSEGGIIHIADIAPLMLSRFDLEDEGDADAMEAIESASTPRQQIAKPGERT